MRAFHKFTNIITIYSPVHVTSINDTYVRKNQDQ